MRVRVCCHCGRISPVTVPIQVFSPCCQKEHWARVPRVDYVLTEADCDFLRCQKIDPEIVEDDCA